MSFKFPINSLFNIKKPNNSNINKPKGISKMSIFIKKPTFYINLNKIRNNVYFTDLQNMKNVEISSSDVSRKEKISKKNSCNKIIHSQIINNEKEYQRYFNSYTILVQDKNYNSIGKKYKNKSFYRISNLKPIYINRNKSEGNSTIKSSDNRSKSSNHGLTKNDLINIFNRRKKFTSSNNRFNKKTNETLTIKNYYSNKNFIKKRDNIDPYNENLKTSFSKISENSRSTNKKNNSNNYFIQNIINDYPINYYSNKKNIFFKKIMNPQKCDLKNSDKNNKKNIKIKRINLTNISEKKPKKFKTEKYNNRNKKTVLKRSLHLFNTTIENPSSNSYFIKFPNKSKNFVFREKQKNNKIDFNTKISCLTEIDESIESAEKVNNKFQLNIKQLKTELHKYEKYMNSNRTMRNKDIKNNHISFGQQLKNNNKDLSKISRIIKLNEKENICKLDKFSKISFGKKLHISKINLSRKNTYKKKLIKSNNSNKTTYNKISPTALDIKTTNLSNNNCKF